MRCLHGQSGPGKNRVLFLSHTHWESEFVVGSHHLARELSLDGWDVLRMVTPLSLMHTVLRRSDTGNSLGRWMNRIETDIDRSGVTNVRVSTILPAQVSGRYGRSVLSRLGFEDPRFIIVDQPLMLDRWVFTTGATVIYRPTDLYLGSDAKRKEAQWLPLVDGLVATSGAVLDGLKSVFPLHSLPTSVIPNGVDLRTFSGGADLGEDRDGVIYVGSLDHRFDWEFLMGVARELEDVLFRIAGPVRDVPDLPANIIVMGAVAYGDVPALMRTASVAIMPLSCADENRGRSPMKLYEFLASGLPVVSTDVLAGIPSSLGEAYFEAHSAD